MNLEVMRKYLSAKIFVVVLSSFLLSCASQNMGLTNELDAGTLANEYASDVKAGSRKYKGRYITVIGKVSQQYKNKYQESIIILMDKKQLNGVKCVLNNASKQLKKPLKQGELIIINGRCAGFDDYVLLTGCIILKN